MTQEINLNKQDLIEFFIHHLNKVYSAKTHLLNRLPEILYQVHFSDLEGAIYETIEIVKNQRERMKQIYKMMDAEINEGNINGLKGLIDDSFDEIKLHQDNPELRDMSIMFYMTNIEATEMASFQILQLLSVKLGSDKIKSLIKENFDEAQSEKALLLLITTKYLGTV
jgi:ferritin-like metal-binding protein YciE